MKSNKGFTLVELVIVIVIVAILSVVGATVYNGYVRQAIFTEGKTLVGAMVQAQKLFYMQNNTFYECWGDFEPELDIDARYNKYFKWFEVEGIYVEESFPDQKSATYSTRSISIRTKPADFTKVKITVFYFRDENTYWSVSVILDGKSGEISPYELEYDKPIYYTK